MPVNRPIYLDYNATTPVDPEVLAAMLPFFMEKFGNAASSTHLYGWEANAAVSKARQAVAALIGAPSATSIVFTSGATEANNLALKGLVAASRLSHPHLITQKTEHGCILDTCHFLESQGARITYLDVDSHGRVTPQQVESALTDETVLVSIMSANNETGTVHPIADIAAIVHRHPHARFHTDAVQAAGKLPIDVEADGIDLLSLSAHKCYGPKGIGALYLGKRRPPIALIPLLHGGGHENGSRSGTLAVPLIAGFGKAAQLARTRLSEDIARVSGQRRRLLEHLTGAIDGIIVNGHPTDCLPNTLNLSIPGIDANTLIAAMPDLALSAGSACASGSLAGSYVIDALCHDPARVRSAVRISLGRVTTDADVDSAGAILVKTINALARVK